jgi:major vault protein
VLAAQPMVMIPPRHYCIVANPAVRAAGGGVQLDEHGQVKIRHGDEEVRFEQDPFPLYPGEKLFGKVSPLQVVGPNQALRLRCIRDFSDDVTKDAKGKAVPRVAGDEWLFEGPATYKPRVEVQVVEIIRAVIVKPQQALKLRARKLTKDARGAERKAGEEWLWDAVGAYMPGVDEEIVETLNAFVLTDRKALHLRATRTFTDAQGVERKAGEEWLVTALQAPTHISGVYEKVVGEVSLTTLSNRQYCVVLDPFDKATRKLRLGQKELRKGELSFFLNPGERLEQGIQNVYVLGEEEALLLRAREAFGAGADKHEPGDRWMVYGPRDYIPPVEVEVVEKRKSIPLDANEGIYLRDIKTGAVSRISGKSYMLKPNEELWEKELPKVVEDLLAEQDETLADGGRDRTRVVTYRAPHNSAVQLYDYKTKLSRVVLGPELVMLGPEEQFSVLSLSGDKPKRPHAIKALALLLGPDFMTDIVIVETSDHARLSLKLSYNWHFEYDEKDPAKIFSVPDFVGDACKAIASRVRGAVAQTSFDSFHKHSALVIRKAVFGVTNDGIVRNRFTFSANRLVITNIDIQSVEPVDQRTRDSLQKSVQQAIEITTKSQEAAARHEAERLEQEARGLLERQKITDESAAEKARAELLQLLAQSAAVESTGQATAEAKARAASATIEGEAAVRQAELKAKASQIRTEAELAQIKARQLAEVEHQKALDELEVEMAREMSSIDAGKIARIVKAVGPSTLTQMARASEDSKARLLKGLGLNSVLLTDPSSGASLNLSGIANNLVKGRNGAPDTKLLK